MKDKILITGGAGFIGSHLAEYFLKEGNQVEILDDLSSGNLKNISSFSDHPKLSCNIGSVLDRRTLKKLIKRSDFVFHLAAGVGVKKVITEPLKSIKTNIEGTSNVLEMTSLFKRKVFITSSSEVYGKNEKTPFSEDDDTLLGSSQIKRWNYACAKLLDEFLALAYFREEGSPVIVVRPFGVIGTRQSGKYGAVVPRFINQALSGKPITIYGDGNQIRSFTHVSDAVEATAKLKNCSLAFGKVFNIGNPENTISIGDLAVLIKKLTGSKSAITHISYCKVYGDGEDIKKRVPDIKKIKQMIGFSPKIRLEEALIKIIKNER